MVDASRSIQGSSSPTPIPQNVHSPFTPRRPHIRQHDTRPIFTLIPRLPHLHKPHGVANQLFSSVRGVFDWAHVVDRVTVDRMSVIEVFPSRGLNEEKESTFVQNICPVKPVMEGSARYL